MNIIKIQDQLKNVPDDALVGYVQTPTGQVPTYLALSELQRRKEMRSKYQAAKPEEKTVAEDLVQEAQPQMAGVMGLPAGQPMQQAMQPPPEMPTEQMAQGGLTDLAMDNQMFNEENFATGGIVAFKDGGDTSEPWYKHMKLFGTDYSLVPPSEEEIRALQDKVSPNPFLGGMPETNSSYVPYNIADPEPRPYPSDKKPIPGSKVVPPKKETKTKPETKSETRTVPSAYDLEKVRGIGDYAKELQDYVGPDESRKALNERIAKMDARAAKMEEQAPWLALAQAGFKAASQRPEYGKGQSALADIAEGAAVGFKSYTDAQDKLATLEEKRFGLVADMSKADRAEKMAVAKYGADSKQAVEERNFKRKLQQQHDNVLMQMNDADNAAALAKAAAANRLDQKDVLKYKNDYRANHPEYIAWQQKVVKDKGKNIITTKEFKDASDALLNQLITRDLNQTKGTASSSMIDTSQWSLAS
jgi:hypothetical protein